MKKSKIEVGKTYSNGKGRERKVIGIGPEFKWCDNQTCTENVRYEIVKDGSKGNRTKGKQQNMTLAAFSAWAKEEA